VSVPTGGHLVVVDMQHVFADPHSAWHVPRFAEVVPRVAALVERFDADVSFTRFIAPPEPAGAWRGYYDRFPFALASADAPLYRLVDEFAGRPTLDAPTFGKWGASLASRVGAGPLVLTGVSSDCCVLSTAVAAADAGMSVRVVADACAGATDDSHAAALSVLALYAPLIEVV
jgi:nicotinamidase-related amidase